ncbi:MAG: hypothetical protein O8C62_02770 [Candidatus Methanoperedens sp.]|nr:hypothetical protein [Candidatus Methanoperedens sp.]
MKVAADTSSLMSLEFIGILDDAFSVTDIYITNIVEEELKEIAGFSDEKSRIAKKILKFVYNGKISCIHVKNGLFSRYISKNVDAGEASCLALCIMKKIPFLITDDADAAYSLGKIAMQKGIKIRICVAIIIELIKSNRISKSEAKSKIEELIKKRSWEGGVLEVLTKKYLEENE